MADPGRIHTVAVINSMEMLRHALQHAGFTSIVTGHVTDMREGRVDFVRFLEEHDPQVLVYDIYRLTVRRQASPATPPRRTGAQRPR